MGKKGKPNMSRAQKARHNSGKRPLLAALAVLSVLGSATIAMAAPASAAVTSVTGRAYGFYSKVSLFGGPATTCGNPATTPCPRPQVLLPTGGSATARTKTLASEDLTYGPAHVFDSGRIHVSTQGTPAGGSATSSSSIAGCATAVSNGCNVGEIYAGPFTATNVSATCTASGSTGFTGSITINGGRLQNGAGYYTIPLHPAPNKTYTGTNPDTGKTYKFVFNQRILNPNGSRTVIAVHEYLQAGSTGAQGNLLFGVVTCGVS
jgi:hypothetical protein